LDQCDSTLDEVREQIEDFRRDTLMKNLFRDSSLMKAFQPQMQQLKSKWREVDSLVTLNGQELNTLKSHASAHSITVGEMLNQVDKELKAVGSRAFQKEQPYLWQPSDSATKIFAENFTETFDSESQLAKFYFANTRNNRLWLFIVGILFYFWVNSNFRSLRHLNKLESINFLSIHYITPQPLVASLIFILNLAPFFDIRGPAIYIEFILFLLMLLLIFMLRNRIAPRLLNAWYIFICLFLVLFCSRIFSFSLAAQRWVMLTVDICAIGLGINLLARAELRDHKWLVFGTGLYLLLNFLAVVCNLTSRVTLAEIFANTSFYSLAQAISLAIFVRLVVESFLLQVQASRMRKNYPQSFDNSFISKSILRLSTIVAVILWLIVFTINLNIFDALNDLLVELFTKTRKVGNFSFTIGGIVLFLGIIWIANFLQKYIGYFFGDTGDDAAIVDRGQRSRLMVTRLILLVAGFLLAVAASGLAVDRITVILGALGVGVGLGLQNIVNNFVSGIILIFDRPLRIGDIVDIGDKRGRVKGIGIRSSTLLTEDGAEVIIPNGDVLSQHIVNWTLSNNNARVALSFAINKPANPDTIDFAPIRKIVSENKHVLKSRDPEIVLSLVNSKTMDLKVFFWVNDFSKETIVSDEVKTSVYQYLETKGLVTA
jgi:small-conductance mechanosensitive channel